MVPVPLRVVVVRLSSLCACVSGEGMCSSGAVISDHLARVCICTPACPPVHVDGRLGSLAGTCLARSLTRIAGWSALVGCPSLAQLVSGPERRAAALDAFFAICFLAIYCTSDSVLIYLAPQVCTCTLRGWKYMVPCIPCSLSLPPVSRSASSYEAEQRRTPASLPTSPPPAPRTSPAPTPAGGEYLPGLWAPITGHHLQPC